MANIAGQLAMVGGAAIAVRRADRRCGREFTAAGPLFDFLNLNSGMKRFWCIVGKTGTAAWSKIGPLSTKHTI